MSIFALRGSEEGWIHGRPAGVEAGTDGSPGSVWALQRVGRRFTDTFLLVEGRGTLFFTCLLKLVLELWDWDGCFWWCPLYFFSLFTILKITIDFCIFSSFQRERRQDWIT